MKFLLANATFDDPDEPAQCWPSDNANKPHRYGLLVKSLNDARVPFTYKATSYSGKSKDGSGPYYIDQTENYVKYLVEQF